MARHASLKSLPSLSCPHSLHIIVPFVSSSSTMSVLLTPPNSSHRTDKEKENKYPAPVAGPSTRTVAWALENSIHCLGTPPKPSTISSRNRPKASKSILRKSAQTNLLAVPEATKQREITPEPVDPLVNLNYLERPVDQIISNDSPDEASLRQVIEGYNVLAARLRACVTDSTNADASWPLFQPLRKNADAFVDAVVRDLGRALVDPLSYRTRAEEADAIDVPKFPLPSPQKSPMKKKGGLTAEQVKYARDVCTTCHSVIRLLSAVLSIKAVYSVFQGEFHKPVHAFRPNVSPRKSTWTNIDCCTCHSHGRGAAYPKCSQNMRIGNLADPDSATTSCCLTTCS